MPKIVDPAEERQKILDALELSLTTKPFTKVTMRDVATKAKISHPKILNYFPTKEAMLHDYLAVVTDRYNQEIMRLPSKLSANHPVQIRELVNLIFDLDPDKRYERIFLQIYGIGLYQTEYQTMIRQSFATWESAIQQIFARTPTPIDQATSRLVLAFTEGLLLMNAQGVLSKADALATLPKFFKLK